MPKKEIWQMTRAEWMSSPREWIGTVRLVTLNEWRSANGYSNPLDDHGDFRHPHGISKIVKKRIYDRYCARRDSAVAGAKRYAELLEAGAVPTVQEAFWFRADGFDSESLLAAGRIYHKRMVYKAIKDNLPVPAEVLADYPQYQSLIPQGDQLSLWGGMSPLQQQTQGGVLCLQ